MLMFGLFFVLYSLGVFSPVFHEAKFGVMTNFRGKFVRALIKCQTNTMTMQQKCYWYSGSLYHTVIGIVRRLSIEIVPI